MHKLNNQNVHLHRVLEQQAQTIGQLTSELQAVKRSQLAHTKSKVLQNQHQVRTDQQFNQQQENSQGDETRGNYCCILFSLLYYAEGYFEYNTIQKYLFSLVFAYL